MDAVEGVKISKVKSKTKFFVLTSEIPKNDCVQNFVNFLKT